MWYEALKMYQPPAKAESRPTLKFKEFEQRDQESNLQLIMHALHDDSIVSIAKWLASSKEGTGKSPVTRVGGRRAFIHKIQFPLENDQRVSKEARTKALEVVNGNRSEGAGLGLMRDVGSTKKLARYILSHAKEHGVDFQRKEEPQEQPQQQQMDFSPAGPEWSEPSPKESQDQILKMLSGITRGDETYRRANNMVMNYKLYNPGSVAKAKRILQEKWLEAIQRLRDQADIDQEQDYWRTVYHRDAGKVL